ncbi:MAG: hypothetical protein MASP_01344 [Candidatus Methanolliviera sp. GoM_asphalt]|nr:MAG: hypothetical protein MASP_01344 [Candidatus Methanolliviera sp. GoM_asphalt]
MKIELVSPFHYTYAPMLLGGILKDEGFDVEISNTLTRKSAEIILLSLYSTLHLIDKDIKNFIQKNKGKEIIVGGPISTCPEMVLEELPVDTVVVGEGEETILDILNDGISEDIKGVAFLEDGDVIKTPPKPVSNIDRPIPLIPDDIRNENIRGANVYIETHRGCIGNCGFCQVPRYFGRKIRSRSIENILEEVKAFKEKGCNRIAISGGTESLYGFDKKINNPALIELLQGISEIMGKKGVSAPDLRVDYINDEVLDAIRDYTIGWVFFGIESGSDRILKRMRKGVTVEKCFQGVEMAKEHGLNVAACFIVGYPGEEEEDFEETKNFMEEAMLHDFFVSIAEPIPKTPLAEEVLSMDTDENTVFKKHEGKYRVYGLTEAEARFFDLSLCGETNKFFSRIVDQNLFEIYLNAARKEGDDTRKITELLFKHKSSC